MFIDIVQYEGVVELPSDFFNEGEKSEQVDKLLDEVHILLYTQ